MYNISSNRSRPNNSELCSVNGVAKCRVVALYPVPFPSANTAEVGCKTRFDEALRRTYSLTSPSDDRNNQTL